LTKSGNTNGAVFAMISTILDAKQFFFYFVCGLGCFSTGYEKRYFSYFYELYPYVSQKVFATALAKVELGGFLASTSFCSDHGQMFLSFVFNEKFFSTK
jgi:hypothetical protein